MVDMENTVAVTQPDSVSVDAVQDQATVKTENELEKLLLAEDRAQEAAASETETSEDEQAHEEAVPKGIKGRIQAAEAKADQRGYDRGRQEALKELENYKASVAEKIRKLEELELEEEAKQLAKQENISLGIAKRLIKAERGLPTTERTPEPPARDDNGRFSSVKADSGVRERAEMLMKQAESIKTAYGADVLETFKNDKTVQQKVGSGEWDMRDVYIHMLNTKPKTDAAQEADAPSPIRSGGGAQRGINANDIAGLSNRAFEKMQESIRKGKVYKFE